MDMSIDWLKLVAALLLLLCPAGVFHGRQVHFRALSRDWHGYWRRSILLWTAGFDLVRAGIGVWLLKDAVLRLPEAQGLMRHAPMLAQAGVLVLASAVQTLVCRERDAMLAPFAFVVGVVFGYLPPLIVVFGLALAVVVAMGTRSGAAFFPALAVGTVATGYLFTQKSLLLPLVIAATTVILPWMLTLLLSRHFVVPYQGHHARKHLH